MDNKIRYSLKLTNIHMTDDACEVISKKLKTAYADASKRKLKKRAVIFGAVFAAVLLLIAGVVVVSKLRGTQTDITPLLPATLPADETTGPKIDPPVVDDYVYITPLYQNDRDYGFFKDVTQLVKINGTEIGVSEDISAMYQYFNTTDLSHGDLCLTVTSFLSDLNSIIIYNPLRSMPEDCSDEMRALLSDIKKAYDGRNSGIYQRECIALTAKYGTFEYLLTFTYYVEAHIDPILSSSMLDSANSVIYNSVGEAIGRFQNGELKIKKSRLGSLHASIYKIRFENGIPVIYGRKTVEKDELKDARDTNTEDILGITPFGLVFAHNTLPEYKTVLTSATLSFTGNTAVCFTSDTNAMKNDMSPPASGISFIYSAPTGIDGTSSVSRSEVTEIINSFNLQWFIPMYRSEMPYSKVIIGAAIALDREDPLIFKNIESSSAMRLISTEKGVTFADFYTRERKPVYYNGSKYDRPYFASKSSFDELTLLKISNVNGALTCEPVSAEYVINNFIKQGWKLRDDAQTFIYPYLVNAGNYGYVTPGTTKPLSMWLLPYVDSALRPGYLGSELLESLNVTPAVPGKLVTEYGALPRYNVNMREMYGYHDAETYSEEDNCKYDLFIVYELSSFFCIDIYGRMTGLVVDGDYCPFDTTSSIFETGMYVISRDGEFVYMGPPDGVAAYNMFEFEYTPNYKMTECGLMLGTLLDALQNEEYMEYLPVIRIYENHLETYFDVCTVEKLSYVIYPVVENGEKAYHYDNGIVKYVDAGGSHWTSGSGDASAIANTFTCIIYYDSEKAALRVINGYIPPAETGVIRYDMTDPILYD